ncbi:MAG: hypothetical protein Q9169_004112 [Polycauliona sp. 2 TL-2023]
MFPPTILLTALTLITKSIAETTNSTACQRSQYYQNLQSLLHPNATGSVTARGYSASSSIASSRTPANSSWTYHTTIFVDAEAAIWQYYSLDTGTTFPPGTAPSDIPFHLCMQAMGNLRQDVYANAAAQDGTRDGNCESVLSRECIDAIKEQGLQDAGRGGTCSAAVFRGTGVGKNVPVECEGAFYTAEKIAGPLTDVRVPFEDHGSIIGGSLFEKSSDDDDPDEDTEDDSADMEACGIAIPDKNSTVHRIFGVSGGPHSNRTKYDEAVHRVIPFLTVIVSDQDDGTSLSAAELVCLRAKDIVAGSRVPEALPQADSSTSTTSSPGDAQSLAAWSKRVE